jgi:hypothetical protein
LNDVVGDLRVGGNNTGAFENSDAVLDERGRVLGAKVD